MALNTDRLAMALGQAKRAAGREAEILIIVRKDGAVHTTGDLSHSDAYVELRDLLHEAKVEAELPEGGTEIDPGVAGKAVAEANGDPEPHVRRTRPRGVPRDPSDQALQGDGEAES